MKFEVTLHLVAGKTDDSIFEETFICTTRGNVWTTVCQISGDDSLTRPIVKEVVRKIGHKEVRILTLFVPSQFMMSPHLDISAKDAGLYLAFLGVGQKRRGSCGILRGIDECATADKVQFGWRQLQDDDMIEIGPDNDNGRFHAPIRFRINIRRIRDHPDPSSPGSPLFTEAPTSPAQVSSPLTPLPLWRQRTRRRVASTPPSSPEAPEMSDQELRAQQEKKRSQGEGLRASVSTVSDTSSGDGEVLLPSPVLVPPGKPPRLLYSLVRKQKEEGHIVLSGKVGSKRVLEEYIRESVTKKRLRRKG